MTEEVCVLVCSMEKKRTVELKTRKRDKGRLEEQKWVGKKWPTLAHCRGRLCKHFLHLSIVYKGIQKVWIRVHVNYLPDHGW